MVESARANPVGVVFRGIHYRGVRSLAEAVADSGLRVDQVRSILARLVREQLIEAYEAEGGIRYRVIPRE